MGPLNKGHIGIRSTVPYREAVTNRWYIFGCPLQMLISEGPLSEAVLVFKVTLDFYCSVSEMYSM